MYEYFLQIEHLHYLRASQEDEPRTERSNLMVQYDDDAPRATGAGNIGPGRVGQGF